jgi:hypothetical protein
MSHLMFDSDDLSVLAKNGNIGQVDWIATYADIVTTAFIDQFKGRLRIIDRGAGDPLNVATIADVEDGALTAAQAADKIRTWQTGGRHGCTVYSDRSDVASVAEACKGLTYYSWVATLDGTLLYNGYPTAVQFAGEDSLGFHADISVVWDDGWIMWPPAPAPANYTSIKNVVTANAQSIINMVKDL